MTRGPTPSVNRPQYRPFSRPTSPSTCTDADRWTTRRGTRNDVPPAVHSLWTPVWNQCGSASTTAAAAGTERAVVPEVPGAAGGRLHGEEERHGRCHAG